VLTGDSGYGMVALACACRMQDMALVARLPLEAALYAPIPSQQPGKPGVKTERGQSLSAPSARRGDPMTVWLRQVVRWYVGAPPIPIYSVLLRDPSGELRPTALFRRVQWHDPGT